MNAITRISLRVSLATLALSLAPLTAVAQSNVGAPGNNRGPMSVERITGSWLLAPDLKITKVNHVTSELAGVYGGYLWDNHLLVGAGGYWLTNRTSSRRLQYGGAVVGWLAGTDRRIGFGAKGLVGFGEATIGTTLGATSDGRFGLPQFDGWFDRHVPTSSFSLTTPVRLRQDFLLAEPEANVFVNLTTRLRLTGGVSYRFTDASRGMDHQLRGTAASIALQIS
jgi:hypothetical protein